MEDNTGVYKIHDQQMEAFNLKKNIQIYWIST